MAATVLLRVPHVRSGVVCRAQARLWRTTAGVGLRAAGANACAHVPQPRSHPGTRWSCRGLTTVCSPGMWRREHRHAMGAGLGNLCMNQGAGQRRGFARSRKAVFVCGDCGGEHVKVRAFECARAGRCACVCTLHGTGR